MATFQSGVLTYWNAAMFNSSDTPQLGSERPGSELDFRHFLETLPAAAYSTDARGQITYFNQRAAEVWGRAPKLDDPAERYCGSFRLFWPDGTSLQHDECWMARCLHERRRFLGEEIVVEQPGGKRLLVQAFATPHFNHAGELIGAVNVLVDITERIQSEAFSARLAAIVESSGDAIISIDLHGVITSWNRAAVELYGYTAEEALGQKVTLLLPAERQDEEPAILARVCQGERVDHYETIHLRKDGSLLQISLTVSPIIDSKGQVVGASKIGRNISERHRAEAALRRSEELLSAELNDAKLLQSISAALIEEANVESLYGKILDAAMTIMRSDFASMQMLYPERGAAGELRLLGCRGFPAEASKFWEWVRTDSNCTCGLALRSEARVIDPDVANSQVMAGTADQAALLQNGMRAAQSTPLVSRDGAIVGMISTHWSCPHQPAERDLRLLDVLARQAADLIDRHRSAEQIKALNAQLTADLAAMTRMQQVSTQLVQTNDFGDLLEEILDAAIEITNADMGNIQLLEAGVLKIATQRGFSAPFLDYFQSVHGGQAACGAAMDSAQRVIVEDVTSSPLFAEGAARRAMLEANARAVQSTPLVSRSGQILGMFSTHYRTPRRPNPRELRLLDLLARQAADLIERKQAEERLRQQTERLHLLWDAAAILLTAVDPDSMLRGLLHKIGPEFGLDVYFNYMVNESGDALRLASCDGIPSEAARQITRLEFGQAICGTVAVQRQPIVATRIQESDDAKCQLVKSFGIKAYACNPLMAGTRLLGTLSFASRQKDEFTADEIGVLETICRYVTVAYERLRLLDELKEADRRKDEFLATLAHELRNPLAPVRSALKILEIKGSNAPEARWGREVIDRQIEHLTRLIDDLLDVSRITRNKLELRTQRITLSEIIQAAAESSRPTIEQFGHELTIALPPNPVYLNGDLVRLAQVFLNLLNNAAKYTERGGKIWVTAEQHKDQVVVRVKDNGVGIPGEKLPRLFDLFFQVDRTQDRSQGGLGIGLSLVRRLVELHGGTVEASSDGAGRGSEFTVRLPVLAEKVNFPSPGPLEEDGSSANTGHRVLVVDDNRDAADSVAMLLRLLGNQVQTTYDGVSGIEAARRFRPQIVLLDIGMPKLNGEDTCRRIRAEAWGKDMVIVAMTGWGQAEDRRRTVEAGFNAHMVKPVDVAALMKLLKSQPSLNENPVASDSMLVANNDRTISFAAHNAQ